MSDTGDRANSIKRSWDRKLNDVFEHVFEQSLIGMAILDSDGHFLRINEKACEIWEYTEIELIGKTWQDITHKDDIEESSQFVDSYKNQPPHYSSILEKRYVTGNGKVKTCKITITAIHKPNNDIEYFIAQIQDISIRKDAINCIQKGLEIIKKIQER